MGQIECLGVIPARGGSERVKRKNMRELGGQPLISWTLNAAKDSRLSRFVVSTEDVEISAHCKREGVEVVPQPLDSALSGTMSAPVVVSALEYLSSTEDYQPEHVMLLHPTSPFRTSHDINCCLDLASYWPGSVISFTNDDLNGAIYVAQTRDFLKDASFFHQPILPYNMGTLTGLDIDYPEDLKRAREYIEEAVAA